MPLTINQRIMRYRKFKGYTQHDMAAVLNMKTSTYSQKERKGIIDSQFLIDISNILQVDVKYLLYGEKPPENTEFELPYKLTQRDINLLTIFHNVSSKKRDAIYEFAYNIFKNK